ncbi:hypothetical protein D3C75_760150 [compost metagenome]
MEDWAVQFAKMLRERDNPAPVGFVIGEVVAGPPEIKIALGKEILLESRQLRIADGLQHKHTHTEDEYHTPVPLPLEAGDQVIMIPSPDGQTFAVLDKVG